jgi:hypothetical protein
MYTHHTEDPEDDAQHTWFVGAAAAPPRLEQLATTNAPKARCTASCVPRTVTAVGATLRQTERILFA